MTNIFSISNEIFLTIPEHLQWEEKKNRLKGLSKQYVYKQNG